MAKTFFATAPNGQQFKRTSQNRTYPWAVLAGPPTAEALAAICDNQAAIYIAEAKQISDALAANASTFKSRGFGSGDNDLYFGKPSYTGWELRLKGTEVYVWANSKGETNRGWATFKGQEGYGDQVIEASTELVNLAKYKIQDFTERAAALSEKAAKYRSEGISARENNWEAIRWTSRFELGKSYIESEFGYYSQRGQELILVETIEKEGKVKA